MMHSMGRRPHEGKSLFMARRNLIARSAVSSAVIQCCLIAQSVHAQVAAIRPLTGQTSARVTQALAEELAKQQGVGLAVGIIEGGRVVYVNGLGFADREQNRPVTPETVFNWASNSKPVAAIAAMQLVEAGKLDLDKDVREYVPEFPEKGTVITSRMLLCHQSGIPHYTNGKIIPTKREYGVENPFLDPVNALDTFNQSPLLFTPGERCEYSSFAYILMSAVIQRAGGEPFFDQVQERIAKPLGMATLQLDLAASKLEWATGYTMSKGRVMPVKDRSHGWKAGAGAFKSTVGDFAKFAEALINRRLVAPATYARMWQPQKLKSGKPTDWALGFTVEQERAGIKVSHGGRQDETTTRLVLYPATKRGMVVMSNCGFTDVGQFSTAAFRAFGPR